MTSTAATAVSLQRVLDTMTRDEKLAQLVGIWQDESGDVVAPLQGQQTQTASLDEGIRHGLGHLTRPYGTNPVDPIEKAQWLAAFQQRLATQTRLGIPALVHEECLTGLAIWKAATFPTPAAWGAAFAPDLVERMAELIGQSMRELGVHQGLAPVLDVIRDPRWGRVDECIAEDPYLVGTVGTAFVRGIQGAGVHATLKHFVGYSGSQSGRNFGPVHAGPREVADVLLPPFEMAVKDGQVRSVMHSYAEIDGVPVASDPRLLTDLLRTEWGFDGVVVADYFGVAFLHVLHDVAANLAEAAALALEAGVDVELPSGDAYLAPLAEAIRSGRISEDLVDRALARVLRQKQEVGLLDAQFRPLPQPAPPAHVELDSPAHREAARALAERSAVLLANDGTLPLARPGTVAVIGPNADRPQALFGCYSFANHVLDKRPGYPLGFECPSVREAVEAEFPGAVTFAPGCSVDGPDTSGFAQAVDAARHADVAVVVVGDRAGLFGRGTVGEGCDVESLELPGVQRELVERVVATGTPVVMVLVTGRPYVVDWALASCAAVVQTFFPGEEGAAAIAGILSGRVNPSGHLPVSMPRSTGAQPYSYLHPSLGGNGDVTNVPSTPARPFGFGLSFTTFAYSELSAPARCDTDSAVSLSVTVTNTGTRAGEDVVQVYARDVVGSVTRPLAQLVGYLRVALEPGESATVDFEVPPARLAFSDRTMRRVVEPGTVEFWVGDCETREVEASVEYTGGVYEVGGQDVRMTSAVRRATVYR